MEQLPVRNVSSPLTEDMLAPLRESHQWLQFSVRPTPPELDRIAALLERHPTVGLRAYGGYDCSIRDLDFLAHFPTLRRFRVDVLDLDSIEGLRHLPGDLDVLGIGETRRRTPIDQVVRFAQLRSLDLAKNVSRIEVLSN